MKSKFYSIWKETALEHFDKNAHLIAFSKPFPVENPPTKTKVLCSLLVPQLNQDEFIKNILKFKIRHAIDGSPIIESIEDTYFILVPYWVFVL